MRSLSPLLFAILTILAAWVFMPAAAPGADDEAVATRPQIDDKDARFLDRFREGGLYGRRSSEAILELENVPEDVRDFAKDAKQGQDKIDGELTKLLKQKGIDAEQAVALSDDHNREIQDFQRKVARNERFVDDWLDDQVDMHEKAVERLEEAGTDAKDPEIRAFALRQIPVLQERLDRVRRLEQKYG